MAIYDPRKTRLNQPQPAPKAPQAVAPIKMPGKPYVPPKTIQPPKIVGAQPQPGGPPPYQATQPAPIRAPQYGTPGPVPHLAPPNAHLVPQPGQQSPMPGYQNPPVKPYPSVVQQQQQQPGRGDIDWYKMFLGGR